MRAPRSWTTLLALFALLGVASCDRHGQHERLTGADALVQSQAAAAVVLGDDGQPYTLIQDRLPQGIPSIQLTRLIGFGGGQIALAGHTLSVPVGAVTQPTLFTLRLVPDGYVEVELKALGTGLLGRVINVGADGFAEPVTASLTYARSPNVSNPGTLTLLRLQGDRFTGVHEVLESRVDEARQTVEAELDRFSRFCMAEG